MMEMENQENKPKVLDIEYGTQDSNSKGQILGRPMLMTGAGIGCTGTEGN